MACHQSSVISHQSPVTSHQSPVISHQRRRCGVPCHSPDHTLLSVTPQPLHARAHACPSPCMEPMLSGPVRLWPVASNVRSLPFPLTMAQ